MPRLLLDRLRPNSVSEFRAAARSRFQDGLALVLADSRTAAVYLFGYVAEMELKAAYFALAGFAPQQPILMSHLVSAKNNALQMGLTWTGNLHDVAAWAEFLVYLRRTTSQVAYAPAFESELLAKSREVSRRWRETLRFHANLAYTHEVRTLQEAANWFLENEKTL